MVDALRGDVLFLAPRFSDSGPGGIAASATLAWDALRRSFPRSQRLEVGPVRNFGMLSHLGASPVVWKGAALLRAAALRPSSTVVVWHLGLLKLLPALRRRPSRLVLFLHGVEAWNTHHERTSRYLSRVDLFLSNSDHTWEGFTRLNPQFERSRYRTVHLGIGVPNEPIEAPAPTPSALMLGRLMRSEDYKGHREVIESWPLICASIPKATLVIAGDGDLRPDLEKQVTQLGLEEHVCFVGWVSEKEKDRLIRSSRCLVLPSRGEGFGLVYLEAMRMGRPCVVSDVDAGREVVSDDGGIAVDPRDSVALASAIIDSMASDANWQRLSRGAKARYDANFTAAAFQDRLIAAMRDE